MRAIIAVLVLSLLSVFVQTPITQARVKAAGNQTLTMQYLPGETNFYRVVEQQSPLDPWPGDVCTDPSIVYEGVTCNRTEIEYGTKCSWDVDDSIKIAVLGTNLKPGQEVSLTNCHIADISHIYGMTQTAGSGFTLQIDFYLNGALHKSISTRGDRVCIEGPMVAPDSPLRVIIPNSDGGNGIPGAVTFRIRNDTSRTLKMSPNGAFNIESDIYGSSEPQSRLCPQGFWLHENGTIEDLPNGITYVWDLP